AAGTAAAAARYRRTRDRHDDGVRTRTRAQLAARSRHRVRFVLRGRAGVAVAWAILKTDRYGKPPKTATDRRGDPGGTDSDAGAGDVSWAAWQCRGQCRQQRRGTA